MDNYEEDIWVLRKLLAQRTNEFDTRITIVHSKRTANTENTSLLPQRCRDLSTHTTLKGRNALSTVALLCKADRFLGGKSRRDFGRGWGRLRNHSLPAAKARQEC